MAWYRPYAPRVRALTAQEFTRPANVTQYTAGDSVGTASVSTWSFTGAARDKYQGAYIKAVRLSKSDSGVTAATFRIVFYTTDVADIADNAAGGILYADRAGFLGYADVTMVAGGAAGGAVGYVDDLNIPIHNATTIYAQIIATGTYTPVSAETFSLTPFVEQL